MESDEKNWRKRMGLPEKMEYTVDDIMALPGNARAEVIDGKIYAMAPPSYRHQKIVIELACSFKIHINGKQSGCEVLVAPFGIFLNDEKNYLEPDIVVICDRDKISERGCEGAPDLVVEIVSESTKQRDYGIKLLKYRTAGVREYWVVNPAMSTIMVYNFEDENKNNQYAFSDQIVSHVMEDYTVCLSALLEESFTASMHEECE